MTGGTRPSGARASQAETEEALAAMLAIIREEPAIRPSEINRRLGRSQSESLRAAVIRRGRVRKVKQGRTTHPYAL